MQIPLYESVTAVAGANGIAVGRLSPSVAGSSWVVERMVTAIPTMSPQDFVNHRVYKNSITEANRLDATSSGAQDTSETNIPLATTDVLIAVWDAVTPGAQCTLTVTGTKETGRSY